MPAIRGIIAELFADTHRFRALNARPPREPVFNVPASVLILLGLLVGVHLLRLVLPTDGEIRLLGWLAFVPLRLTALLDPAAVAQRLQLWDGADGARADLARFFLAQGTWSALPTLLTYALLHGGWAHLGLNAIWLLAFGTPVARRFGAARFMVFVVVAAVAGALTHWALFPFGAEPLIGASAAVSGCMGAAVRFAFRTPRLSEDLDVLAPDEGILATLRDRRALAFIIAWFASNALFGAGAESFGLTDQPVAWQAHIGGFLVGFLLFGWFARPHPAPAVAPDAPDADLPLAR